MVFFSSIYATRSPCSIYLFWWHTCTGRQLGVHPTGRDDARPRTLSSPNNLWWFSLYYSRCRWKGDRFSQVHGFRAFIPILGSRKASMVSVLPTSTNRLRVLRGKLTSIGFSPGRQYSSILLKLMLAHFVLKYDFKLATERMSSKTFKWRTAEIPRSSTKLLIRKCQCWCWILRCQLKLFLAVSFS